MKITTYLEMGPAGCTETIASIDGDVITVDGIVCDLSAIGEGDVSAPDGIHPFATASGKAIPITRVDGVLQVPVRWVFDPATADPDQGNTHPVLIVTSGAVPDPVIRLPAEDPADDV